MTREAPAAATETGGSRSRVLLSVLAVFVVLRLIGHALYVPAYEGPDEPFHLARVFSLAEDPLPSALSGVPTSGVIVAGIRARPYRPGRFPVPGHPPLGPQRSSFNLLHPLPRLAPVAPERNPENNQPPLFYLVPGLVFRALEKLPGRPGSSPEIQLLAVRLFCVGLVAAALFGPLRALSARRPGLFAWAGLALLTLPGASESLARCSNDAAVFFWAGCVLFALEARARPAVLLLLLAAGPMLKLTALPIAAVVLVRLWREGLRQWAVGGVFAAALVVPLQAIRGLWWGGIDELNRPTPPLAEALSATLVGLARSFYAFLKTTFWLGEWSFFRPPLPVLLAAAALAISWLVAGRWRASGGAAIPHLVGAAVALIGFVGFAVANRRFFGVWGGVGGWYAWSWLPWLSVAAHDLFTVDPRWRTSLLAATAAFSLVANAVYYAIACRIYG